MDKDIMKYLIMFNLRFGDEGATDQEAVDFKRVVFPAGYRADTVKGLFTFLCGKNVKLLVRSNERFSIFKLSPKALRLIEENENGI